MDLKAFFKPKKAPLKKPAAKAPKAALKAAAPSLFGKAKAAAGGAKPAAKGALLSPACSPATSPAAAAPSNAEPAAAPTSSLAEPTPKQPAAKAASPAAQEASPEKDDDEPSIVCRGEQLVSGDFVWAKYDDYPWWPCYLCADPAAGDRWLKDDGTVRIIFCGDESEAWVAQSQLKPFLPNLSRHRGDPRIKDALKEALTKLERTDLLETQPKASRPRRVTAKDKQVAQAKKALKARQPKRLKKSQLADSDDDEDLDLGLSEEEELESSGSESGSEFGSDDEEEEDEDDDLSEGEPEDEEEPPAEETGSESEEEEAPKPKKRKKAAAAAPRESAVALGEELSQFACTEPSPRQKQAASKAAAGAQRSSAAAAAPRGPSAPIGGQEVDPKEWKALADQGDWKEARKLRFSQWQHTPAA